MCSEKQWSETTIFTKTNEKCGVKQVSKEFDFWKQNDQFEIIGEADRSFEILKNFGGQFWQLFKAAAPTTLPH